MMNICRICLSLETDKDISELPKDLEDTKTCSDIMFFCISIKVSPESQCTALCDDCYSKVLTFYKFKSLALKNDKYLKSLTETHEIINEDFVADVKCEYNYNNNHSSPNVYEDILYSVKDEPEVKEENYLEYQSEDELLSVIQKIKYENFTEDSKENAPTKKKKTKRKRPKDFKENKKEKQICDVCGKAVANLSEHVALHQSKLSRKKIHCKACDKTFASYSARYRHFKIKHLGIKQHCDECNKDVVSLNSHRKLKHNRELLRFICILCDRRFISQSSLDDHNLTHTRDRPHKCDLCDKAFRNKIYVLQHKRQVHDKEKSHLCQFCSKSFFKKYHLQVHLRSHTKERPYECKECGKFFSSTSTLANHKMIHSDVKKYACKICDMTFCKPNYLRNHMISHTKEKKYPCQYCGVRFGRSDHRLRHQRTAHEQLATA